MRRRTGSAACLMLLGLLGTGCGGTPAAEKVPEASVGAVAEAGLPPRCVVGESACDDNLMCVDDRDDDCGPESGDARCPGRCQSCDDPGLQRSYFERSNLSCSRLRLRCGEEQRPFSDECGCGCERYDKPLD